MATSYRFAIVVYLTTTLHDKLLLARAFALDGLQGNAEFPSHATLCECPSTSSGGFYLALHCLQFCRIMVAAEMFRTRYHRKRRLVRGAAHEVTLSF